VLMRERVLCQDTIPNLEAGLKRVELYKRVVDGANLSRHKQRLLKQAETSQAEASQPHKAQKLLDCQKPSALSCLYHTT